MKQKDRGYDKKFALICDYEATACEVLSKIRTYLKEIDTPDMAFDKNVIPFGNSAHIILPKRYVNKAATVIIKKDRKSYIRHYNAHNAVMKFVYTYVCPSCKKIHKNMKWNWSYNKPNKINVEIKCLDCNKTFKKTLIFMMD